MSSPALIWNLVKKNHAYIVKNNGLILSREPGNLTGRNAFLHSGFPHLSTIDLQSSPKDHKTKLTVGKRKPELANKPSKHFNRLALGPSSFKKGARMLNVVLRRQKFRPDLFTIAMHRWALLYRADHRARLAESAAKKKAAKAAAPATTSTATTAPATK